MNGVVDSLLVSLGYDYDPGDGDRFSKDLDSLQSKATAFVAAITAGATAVYALAIATTRGIDTQGKMSASIGESISDVDALGHAMSLVGEDAGSVENILVGLTSTISEASKGLGAGVEVFGRLGISITDANGSIKDSIDLMLEVSDAMSGLEKGEQIELSKKLGLEPAIKLLQSGSSSIKEMLADAKAIGVASKEDAKIAAEFQDSLTRGMRAIKYLNVLITRETVPYITKITNKMVDWWKANKDFIEQDVGGYIRIVADNIKSLTTIAIAFIAIGLTAKLLSLLVAMKKISVGAIMMNAAIMAVPIIIATAVAAIALLANEADRFFNGEQNVFSDWLRNYPEFKGAIEATLAVFGAMNDTVSMIFKGLKEIFGLFSNGVPWEVHKENLKNLALDLIGQGPVTNPTGDDAGIAESMGRGFLSDIGTWLDRAIGSPMARLDKTIGAYRAEPPLFPGSQTSTVYDINVGEIKIDGARSPEATADAVKRSLLRDRSILSTNRRG